jgi:2-polyprenyl-6-hydroxyphenyl methylase/3-demethylubiquinone-9 3-methyltransferase
MTPLKINNAFYEELNEKWYEASDHPIALLRAENAIRTPWIIREIERRLAKKGTILDIGCGAGLLTNALAVERHQVFGIDLSKTSLDVAGRHDATGRVTYEIANAYEIPYPNQYFDAVCAMDVLEHVEKPARLIQEASRVLKPGGLFFFHTFNRNPLSYLVIIKGVEWCVRNVPKNMHVYSLFIKPKELEKICQEESLSVKYWVGLRPKFLTASFFKMMLTRKVPHHFRFCFSKSLATGYCGIAEKWI